MSQYSKIAKVPPSKVWQSCIQKPAEQWPKWDPDVQAILDCSPGPCANGMTFTFHMMDGNKAPCKLENVKENESVCFKGTFLGGAVTFVGDIQLKPAENEPSSTQVDYSFNMGGILGFVISRLKAKMVDDGVRVGLDNIVKMAQEDTK